MEEGKATTQASNFQSSCGIVSDIMKIYLGKRQCAHNVENETGRACVTLEDRTENTNLKIENRTHKMNPKKGFRWSNISSSSPFINVSFLKVRMSVLFRLVRIGFLLYMLFFRAVGGR